MREFANKFFGSKSTTVGLVIVLGGAAIAAFIGFGSKGEDRPGAPTPQTAETAALTARPESGGEDGAQSPPTDAVEASAEGAGTASDPSAASDGAFSAPAEASSERLLRASSDPAAPSPTRVAAVADARGANSFNRLLKRPASAPNAPPARDGIHDADNPGTELLQWPSVAFEGMPKTSDGNKVDWVKALDEGKIDPRYEADNPNAEPFLLDLVIVRQVKGSMPNVVYPHLQHTQWLDCSNCHDEIFTPQKGANQISMAGILLGQKCGVCHGKVAFPVSDCRRCHAQPKTEEELRALANRSNWLTGGGE